ncbi:MAG: phage major capsid protein, partial [Verrucomicrobiota bacterium]
LVSVGYRVHRMQLEKEEEGVETHRVTLWEPFEISLVSVPADCTVGVGRASDDSATEVTIEIAPDPKTQDPKDPMKRNLLLDPQTAEAGGTAAVTEERNRVKAIRALAQQHNCAQLVDEAIDNGVTIEAFRTMVLEKVYGNRAKPVEVLDPAIGMNDQEIKRYSLVRAIRALANKQPLDGLELEASQAVAKRTRRDPQGFFIPHDVTSRSLAHVHGLDGARVAQLALAIRALNAGTATAGGYTIGTEVLGGSMIELLRNKMLVTSMGARMLSGLVGDIAIPKHTGGATAYWLTETAEVSASQQTFGQLGLTPHRLAGLTAYTKQLLAQSSIDVEGFVRDDLMQVLAIAKDLAVIAGSGVSGEPLGIINVTGINTVTFGAAATRAKAIDFQSTVASDNASRGALAYLTTPAAAAKWMGIAEAANTAEWLWKGNIDEGQVVGRPARSTNQVPNDKVLYGNWNDVIIADWDGMDVVVDPYTLAAQNQVRIVITLMTDTGLRNAVSFCVSTDSGAQ